MCSKQSSLFSFYALPSGGKLKDAVVHWRTDLIPPINKNMQYIYSNGH